MTDLERFILRVQAMRAAQKQYFEFIGKAKKTKQPGDFAAAGVALKTSKNLEEQVDNDARELLTALKGA